MGLTAALQLAWAGQKVAVVEALRVGRQVTGRSTAKITTQHGLIYRHLINTLGTDKARLYANANETAFRYIERLVADHDLDCDYETRDAFVYVGPAVAGGTTWILRHRPRRALASTQRCSRPRPCHSQPGAPYGIRAKHNSTRPNI